MDYQDFFTGRIYIERDEDGDVCEEHISCASDCSICTNDRCPSKEPTICDLCGDNIEDDSDLYLLKYNELKSAKTVHKSCLEFQAKEDEIFFDEKVQEWKNWYNKQNYGTSKH